MDTNKEQTQYLTIPNTTNYDDMSDNNSLISNISTDNISISYQISQTTNDSLQYIHDSMECDDNNDKLYDIRGTMIDNGFIPISEISKTLQGCIWKVFYTERNCDAIIKITNKELSQRKIGIDHRNGSYVECNENINEEINMLHSLNTISDENDTINPAMIQLYKVFDDTLNTFIAMENGGTSLLSFIRDCHTSIQTGTILLSDWIITRDIMMKQMAECLQWLHDERHVCHLDISLENMSIQNVEWEYNISNKTYKLLPTFQIKFIDFGVSELFIQNVNVSVIEDTENECEETEIMTEFDTFDEMSDDDEYYSDEETDIDEFEISFECDKFVGKLKYEAPNVFNHSTFEARRADIWSLGICYFIICTGHSLWDTPTDNDLIYNLVVNQQKLNDVLKHWNISNYMNENTQRLLYRMFSDQMYRADAQEIIQFLSL